MISGLNQEIDILGKVFHFQTELSEGAEMAVRTEVFVGGKIVATRDSQLTLSPEEAKDEEVIRSKMKEQHTRVLKTFVERARRYNEREQDGSFSERVNTPPPETIAPAIAEPSSQAPLKVSAEPEHSGSTPMPGPSLTLAELNPPKLGEAAEALRARRLFGIFRCRMGLTPGYEQTSIGDRIERALEGFDWIMISPTFQQIRVDEQVRCHLLKERIESWVAQGRDVGMAAKIWSGVIAFVGYLTEINDRNDLISFDQQMLVWAIDVVQQHGMTDEIFDRLGLLYGRDPHFDTLLDEPQKISRAAWIAHLRRVLTQL